MVTARLGKIIEENVKRRENDAEGAVMFFDDELRRLKLELEKKEEQISAFKKAHISELPQQTDASFRSLDRLENDINSVNENLQRHSDRLAGLNKAVLEYQAYGRQNPAFKTASTDLTTFSSAKRFKEKLPY
jgi:chromosome segregation ATPase